MNIFQLADDPAQCAEDHCDKHIVKMILEYGQLLSTAHHVLDGEDAPEGIYKKTHVNHPSAVWARESSMNYTWLYTLMGECMDEYNRRYGKDHATERLVPMLCRKPKNMPFGHLTEIPQCMPDEYKREGDPVGAYRAYYKGEKAHFAKWNYTATPYWWDNEEDD